ncbi:MAG: hypothetical protein A2338_04535 [Bacteroidetes bacterium RIFOXYB12_FULL_41_6]|nr:MAG: hypothetical protein A2338_04535 [Bacteroidetes bacterium RIFOXYB12_FULL_41_6]
MIQFYQPLKSPGQQLTGAFLILISGEYKLSKIDVIPQSISFVTTIFPVIFCPFSTEEHCLQQGVYPFTRSKKKLILLLLDFVDFFSCCIRVILVCQFTCLHAFGR